MAEEQLVPIVSENLERAWRDLFRSRQGFTSEGLASNVVQPVIDVSTYLKESASEVLDFNQYLSRFMDTTAGTVRLYGNAVNTINFNLDPGFWEIQFQHVMAMAGYAGLDGYNACNVYYNGQSPIITLYTRALVSTASLNYVINRTFRLFCPIGNYLNIFSGASYTSNGSVDTWSIIGRKIADANGRFLAPAGFSPQMSEDSTLNSPPGGVGPSRMKPKRSTFTKSPPPITTRRSGGTIKK